MILKNNHISSHSKLDLNGANTEVNDSEIGIFLVIRISDKMLFPFWKVNSQVCFKRLRERNKMCIKQLMNWSCPSNATFLWCSFQKHWLLFFCIKSNRSWHSQEWEQGSWWLKLLQNKSYNLISFIVVLGRNWYKILAGQI